MSRSARSCGVLLGCVSTGSWVILIFVFFLPLYRPRAGIVQRTTINSTAINTATTAVVLVGVLDSYNSGTPAMITLQYSMFPGRRVRRDDGTAVAGTTGM